MDMVERVALALADTTDFDGDRMASRYAESELRDMAKAAIRAMLEGLEPVAWRYHYHGAEEFAEFRNWEAMSIIEQTGGMVETPLYDLSALKEAVK